MSYRLRSSVSQPIVPVVPQPERWIPMSEAGVADAKSPKNKVRKEGRTRRLPPSMEAAWRQHGGSTWRLRTRFCVAVNVEVVAAAAWIPSGGQWLGCSLGKTQLAVRLRLPPPGFSHHQGSSHHPRVLHIHFLSSTVHLHRLLGVLLLLLPLLLCGGRSLLLWRGRSFWRGRSLNPLFRFRVERCEKLLQC